MMVIRTLKKKGCKVLNDPYERAPFSLKWLEALICSSQERCQEETFISIRESKE